jgi:ABC-type amino acid transport substrate-binding protein
MVKRFSLFLVAVVALGLCSGMVLADPYVVLSDIPWTPFEMVTDGGEFFGFDLDLLRAVAITAGFEIEIRNFGFDGIVEAVKTNKGDIGMSGFTIRADRDESIDFSTAYYLANQAVVIRKDSALNVVSALAGLGPNKAIGAQSSTTGLWWIQDHLESQFGVDPRGYETYPAAILDLVNKRVDAVIQDEPASVASLAAYPDVLTIAGVINTYEYYGIVVREGDPDGLLPLINDALVTLGLTLVDAPGGLQELIVEEGSVYESLTQIYFEPAAADITAAWIKCKDLILGGDLGGFIDCMKAELGL